MLATIGGHARHAVRTADSLHQLAIRRRRFVVRHLDFCRLRQPRERRASDSSRYEHARSKTCLSPHEMVPIQIPEKVCYTPHS